MTAQRRLDTGAPGIYGGLSRQHLLSIDRGLRSPAKPQAEERAAAAPAPARVLRPLSPAALRRALSPAQPTRGTVAPSSQRDEASRRTEHLKRNLSLASLRVTISTEQRKQLESAMRTWGRASRLRHLVDQQPGLEGEVVDPVPAM